MRGTLDMLPFPYRLHDSHKKMRLIDNLPVDIHQELRSWLEYDDQIMFARANRTISKQLLKLVRALRLGGKNLDFEQKFKSYLISEKLQSLI